MDPSWDEALAEALTVEACGAADPILFLEEREDGFVELDGRAESARAGRSLASGLAASTFGGDDRVSFRSDPRPEDAVELARAVSGRRTGPPPRAEERENCFGGPDPSLPLERAMEVLGRLVGLTVESAPSASVSARWVGFRQEVRIARRRRPVSGDVRQGGRIRLEARAPDGNFPVAAAEAVVPLDLGPSSRVEALQHLPEAVAVRLAQLAAASSLDSGERVVVFGPGVGGVFVHEIIGHALEADTVLSGASWLAKAEGSLTRSGLTVVDDPRRGRAGWKLDDEGELARPIALLRRGAVGEWLHDARSSRHTGQPTTGHGRRGSFREPVRPRMGCTFVAAGHQHPAEALEGVEDGVYVHRMDAGTADPLTGRATFRVTDADRIQRGKITEPVVPHSMLVDGPKALQSVERIANDVEFDPCAGSCLREGQPLATSVGGPTFRIRATLVFS